MDFIYTALQFILWGFFGLVGLLFLFLLIGVVWAGVSVRRNRKKLASRACLNCGEPIGVDAVKDAERRWREYFAELRRQNPGVRFRIKAVWEIHCPNCGFVMTYEIDGRKLAAKE